MRGWRLAAFRYDDSLLMASRILIYAGGDTYQLASGSAQFPNWNPESTSSRQIEASMSGSIPGPFDPANGTLGNVRRNSLFGPGFVGVNLSLGKTFTLWENLKLQRSR